MKLLHTSDWHLGRSLYEFSLLEDQRHFLDWLLGLISDERPDGVLVAGDIYDRPVPSGEAIRLFDHFLSGCALELGVPVLCVAGNHDNATRLEFASSLTRSSGYHIAGRPRDQLTPVTLEDRHGPVHIWLLPYLTPGDARALFPGETVRSFQDAYRLLLSHNPPHSNARNVLVAHGFFGGLGDGKAVQLLTSDSEVSVGGVDIADAALLAGYDYAALGHLHAPQRAGADHIRYSGSPLKYSLSEENQRKSVTLVELGEGGRVETAQLPVPALRDLRTVEGSFAQLMEPGWHSNQHFGDYVFANITDLGAVYPLEKLRTLFPRLLGLRFLAQEYDGAPVIQVGAANRRLGMEELFARFYRDIKGEPLEGEALQVVRETIRELQAEDREEVGAL